MIIGGLYRISKFIKNLDGGLDIDAQTYALFRCTKKIKNLYEITRTTKIPGVPDIQTVSPSWVEWIEPYTVGGFFKKDRVLTKTKDHLNGLNGTIISFRGKHCRIGVEIDNRNQSYFFEPDELERIPVMPNPKKPYVVEEVVRKSPAGKAGIKAGDKISGVNGKALRGESLFNHLKRNGHKPGDVVKVCVLRPLRSGKHKVNRYSIRLESNRHGRAKMGIVGDKAKAENIRRKRLKAKAPAKKASWSPFRSAPKAESLVAPVKVSMKSSPEPEKDVAPSYSHGELKNKGLLATPENDFKAKAREELDLVHALLDDIDGADAFLRAKELRRQLIYKNRGDLNLATSAVNKILSESNVEEEIPKTEGKLRLSRFGKWVIAIGTVLVTAASVGGGVFYLF